MSYKSVPASEEGRDVGQQQPLQREITIKTSLARHQWPDFVIHVTVAHE